MLDVLCQRDPLSLGGRRSFALLWLASVVSQAGDWLLFIALPYHVYGLTGSALATGVTFMLYNVSRLLFSPLAGVLADRWDRRRTLILSNVASGLVLGPLLLFTSADRLWIVYAVVMLQACLAFIQGPAESAFVPQVVRREQLVAANALDAMTNGSARLVGPTLGGALVALFGFPVAVVGDAASFFVAAALVGLIRARPAPARATERSESGPWSELRRDWVEGLDLMRRSPLVRSVLCVNGLVMAGYGAVTVLLVVFVREVLGGGALEFGWVATAQGAGVLAGAGLVGWLCAPGRVLPDRLVALSLLAMGAAYALAFNAPALPVVLASVAVAGLWMTGWSVGQRTLLQRAVPNRYLGRVIGASTTASGLLILVGMGLGSALPDAIGVVPVLTGAAVLYGAAGLLAAATLPGWDAALGAAVAPVDEPPRSVEERSDQPAATGPVG